MNREPVNPDDPQLTAYALGEMTSSERIEFEAKLDVSPLARRELESMEDIMALLSKGLKNEWCLEMKEPNLEVLPAVAAGKVIAPAQFHQSRRAITAVAAAVVAMCLVGAAVFTHDSGVSLAESGESSEAEALDAVVTAAAAQNDAVSAVDPVMLAGVESGVHVPQLFLVEEVEDLESLDLVESLDDLKAPLDASYLESNVIIPASHTIMGASKSGHIGNASPADRVDSYLPPVETGVVRYGIETGLIEGRVRSSRTGSASPARVFVKGYVSMDAGESRIHGLEGFRPVSMSGNPVMNNEKDLELIHELQAIQNELAELAASFPEGSDARAKVSRLYERNRSALADLKRELVR